MDDRTAGERLKDLDAALHLLRTATNRGQTLKAIQAAKEAVLSIAQLPPAPAEVQ